MVSKTRLVEEWVRRQIAEGALGPGDQLPAISALAERFGVSTSSVQMAHRRLEADRLVESRAGSGVYVTPRAGRRDPAAPVARAQAPKLLEVSEDGRSVLMGLRTGPWPRDWQVSRFLERFREFVAGCWEGGARPEGWWPMPHAAAGDDHEVVCWVPVKCTEKVVAEFDALIAEENVPYVCQRVSLVPTASGVVEEEIMRRGEGRPGGISRLRERIGALIPPAAVDADDLAAAQEAVLRAAVLRIACQPTQGWGGRAV